MVLTLAHSRGPTQASACAGAALALWTLASPLAALAQATDAPSATRPTDIFGATGASNAPRAGIVFAPSVSLLETYSDNIALAPDSFALKGWISELIPSLRIDANTARLKGYVDYQFHKLWYSSMPEANSTQNVLAASGRLEAIEKILFVDGRGGIYQQNRSPFDAAVSPDRASASQNRIETRAAQISPLARGQFSDLAAFQARYSATYVTSEDNDPLLPTTRLGEFKARVSSPSRSGKLGWAVDLYSLTAKADSFGTLEDQRFRGLLIYRYDPLLNFSVSYGRETTDTDDRTSSSVNTPGVGVNWQPSPRTQFAALVEKRFFGTGHSALFKYRTPRTNWEVTSSRDAAVLPGVLSGVGSSAVNGLQELLAAAMPDAATREEALQRRLDDAGIEASFPLATGFVTTQPLLYERLGATVTFLGVRNTASLVFTRVAQRALGEAPLLPGFVPGENLRQTGASAAWGHSLTPLTLVTASATTLRSEALSSSVTTRQTLFSLSLSTRLAEKITASIGVRHSDFEAVTPDLSYRENAVYGTVQVKL